MATILIIPPDQTPQLLRSVDPGPYLTGPPTSKATMQQFAKPDVLVNPDLTPVEGVPIHYWKRVGDTVAPMTTQERATLDAAAAATAAAQADAALDALGPSIREAIIAIVKIGNTKWATGQTVTRAQVIAVLKERNP